MHKKEIAGSTVRATARPEPDSDDPRMWSWVEASVWTDRMLGALGNGVRGGRWHSLIDKVYALQTLWVAWQRVAANHGAAGIDRMSLEPIFEKDFLPVSFGFRPGRSCKDALRVVEQALKDGYTWVVDADLQSYFDTIPKRPLLALIKEKVSDGKVLGLLKRFLDQEVMEGMTRWTPVAGTPQGSVISPLMSNLYLHGLDQRLSDAAYKYARFADDFVALCRTRQEAEAVLATIQAWVGQQGLRLNPEKTRVGNCMHKGQGFEFLGYRFAFGRRWVRAKSRKALRDKIREKTARTRSGSLETIISELNPILKGWFGYFQHAHRSSFRDVDGFVRRRLRAILRKREKRPGFGRTTRDHYRWPNAFFAEHGLFTLHEAHVLARQSR
jgi:RNA-directed DNA polymerase